IFQMIMEIQRALTIQVLAIGGISGLGLFGGYLMGGAMTTIIVLILVKLVAVSWGTALCPLATLVASPFVAVGTRYMAIEVFALLFPVMIFLYFFDFTKKLGSKLFRTSMMWVAVPIVQAIFIIIMVMGVKAAERVHLMGAFVALACFVLIGVAPFMMEGMMGSIGGALIHSGYTTSNPRLVFLGALVGGQGASAATTAAWYGALGKQNPTGGDYVEQARAREMAKGIGKERGSGVSTGAAFPPPSRGMRVEQSAAERKELDRQITGLKSERIRALNDTTLTPANRTQKADQIQKEITALSEQRKLTSIAPISDGQRTLIGEKAKSYEDMKKYLDREQMYRYYKEQEAAKKQGLPITGPDLSNHRGEITRAYLSNAFSPGELLRPLGATLGGLMTHMIADTSPLGKSLFAMTDMMMPGMKYETTKDGTKVPVMDQGTRTWRDVGRWFNTNEQGRKIRNVAAFGAGMSVLAAAGIPVLLPAVATGLAIRAMKSLAGMPDERDQKIDDLDKTPGKLDDMRKLRHRQLTGNMQAGDQEKIDKIEKEFGGMKLGDILEKHDTRKLAKTRELEEMRDNARNNGGTLVPANQAEQDKFNEIKDAYSEQLMEGERAKGSALNDQEAMQYIIDNPVHEERQKLQQQKMDEIAKNGENGVKDLIAVGGPEFTATDQAQKTALENTANRAPDQERELDELKRRESNWKKRNELAPIFEVNNNNENIAKRIISERPQLERRLEDFRADREAKLKNVENIIDPNSEEHRHLEGLRSRNAPNLERDEALASYLNPHKRDDLRQDMVRYDEMRHDPAVRGTQAFRDYVNSLNQKYDEDFRHLGIGTAGPLDRRLEGLNNHVNSQLGINQADDERAYARYSTLFQKDTKKMKESERKEFNDLTAYTTKDGSYTRTNLQESLRFQRNEREESENAGKTLDDADNRRFRLKNVISDIDDILR
ncbi:MAG: hypothetical protein PHG85_04505, partial [Candidatus Altiarchaeota archaeon]|nr:hypothetical protein [Candidatus Altiarchaeota archaeon]